MRLKIPYICLVESEKTYFPAMGKPYFYVAQECAVLEEDKWVVIEGKTHGTV